MMMGTKVVPETVVLNELTQLIAQEGFMNVYVVELVNVLF
jgi:hypothetical protein